MRHPHFAWLDGWSIVSSPKAIVNEITITKVIFAIGNNQHSYAAIGGILTSDRLPRVSDATIDSVTKYANISYLL